MKLAGAKSTARVNTACGLKPESGFGEQAELKPRCHEGIRASSLSFTATEGFYAVSLHPERNLRQARLTRTSDTASTGGDQASKP